MRVKTSFTAYDGSMRVPRLPGTLPTDVDVSCDDHLGPFRAIC